MAARPGPLFAPFKRELDRFRPRRLARHLARLSAAEQAALCLEILARGDDNEWMQIALGLEALGAHDFIARLRAADAPARPGAQPKISWRGYELSSVILGRTGVSILNDFVYSLPETMPGSPAPDGCSIIINFPEGRTSDGTAVEPCYSVVPCAVPQAVAGGAGGAGDEVRVVRYSPKFTSAVDALVHHFAVKGDMAAVGRLLDAFPVFLNNVLWACLNYAAHPDVGVAVLLLLLRTPLAHVIPIMSDRHVPGFEAAMTTMSDADAVRKALKRAGVPVDERREFVALIKQTRCAVCGKLTHMHCCEGVYYCCRGHQILHRAEHRAACRRASDARG